MNGDGPTPFATDLLETYVYDRLLGKAGLEDTYVARMDRMHGRLDEAPRPGLRAARRGAGGTAWGLT